MSEIKKKGKHISETIGREQIYKVNMIAILEDLQDQYMTELIPELRHGLKHMMSNASKYTKRFIRNCDSIITDNEDFGYVSDELRDIIESKIRLNK